MAKSLKSRKIETGFLHRDHRSRKGRVPMINLVSKLIKRKKYKLKIQDVD